MKVDIYPSDGSVHERYNNVTKFRYDSELKRVHLEFKGGAGSIPVDTIDQVVIEND